MQVTADRIYLKPPRPGRWSMPMVLAVVVHSVLIAALTWGVSWKKEAEPVAFEAELWSSAVQQAAPRAVAPPPPPPPRAEPQSQPQTEPKVVPKKAPPEPKPKAEPTPPDTP
ncbi:MAG: protein TolA, partial [Hydrogenophaga sp.]